MDGCDAPSGGPHGHSSSRTLACKRPQEDQIQAILTAHTVDTTENAPRELLPANGVLCALRRQWECITTDPAKGEDGQETKNGAD
eukprot:6701364-Pyramimonas_sp.AAC.1